MRHRLLLIESDSPLHEHVRTELLRDDAVDCIRATWNDLRPDAWRAVDAVVLPAAGPRDSLIARIDTLREQSITTPLLAVLGRECGERLLAAALGTADDIVCAPLRPGELRHRLSRLLAPASPTLRSAAENLKREIGLRQLVGEHPTFRRLLDSIPDVASSSAPVMLGGETGTGKELFARAIHALSERHGGPFVPVECGAIPEALIENELFGHSRGAFTDAHRDQAGLAAMAEGGTLFLDEIDSLPLAAQAKLLRFVEAGTYRPLGSDRFTHSDVRLISACNRDLERRVRDGDFRADLYFRLNVIPMQLPPLRERASDVPLLARHFLENLDASKRFSSSAERALRTHPWPGNVRELHNVVLRAVAVGRGPLILPAHLGLKTHAPQAPGSGKFRTARARVIEDFERSYIIEMLLKNGGNVTRAAEAAGTDRRVFGRMMKRYDLDRRTFA